MIKNLKVRLTALTLAATIGLNITGCSLGQTKTEENNDYISQIESTTKLPEEPKTSETILMNSITSSSIIANENFNNSNEFLNYGQSGKTYLNIFIKDMDTEKEIKGIEYDLIDSENNIIKTFTSNNSYNIIHNFKYGETYTIREKNEVEGYQKAQDYSFIILEPKGVSDQYVYNNVTIFKESELYYKKRLNKQHNEINQELFSYINFNVIQYDKELLTEEELKELEPISGENKVNINVFDWYTTEHIEGGIYEIKDLNGKIIDIFELKETGHTIENISSGIYTITEVVSPIGCYQETEPYIFEIPENEYDPNVVTVNLITIEKEKAETSTLSNKNISNTLMLKNSNKKARI